MAAGWTHPITPRYLADVRDPLLAFITAFAPDLAKFALHWEMPLTDIANQTAQL